MRILKVALILGLVAMLAQSASAISFGGYVGPVKMKFANFDVGVIYTVPDNPVGVPWVGEAALNALAQIPPVGGAPLEDTWGVFRITTITNLDETITLYSRTSSPFEITGIFYGERDTYLDQVTTGGLISQDIHGVGMSLAFFQGPHNFLPTAGPGARATPLPVYLTATDGTPIWTMNSVPGFNGLFPTDEFFTTFFPTALPGEDNASGGFWANMGPVPHWGTGGSNGQFDVGNPVPALVDVKFKFGGIPGADGWLVLSDDPIRTQVVPEPLTMLGVLASIGGIAGYIRKRRLA